MKKAGILILAILALVSCNNKEKGASSNEISVSILPQKYFVSKIAGESFKINVMIPPGASPATYEPTPSQLTSLSKTKLYLKMGYTGFELAWMNKLSSANSEMLIEDLSDGIKLIMEDVSHNHDGVASNHHDGGVDPHIWLSPRNVKVISENIYKALAKTYPEQKEEFHKNLLSFQAEIDTLDQYISSALQNLTSRSFFTYHPALSYFARDYNLDQHPLELGGKEPSPAYLKHLIDIGKENNIGVVFLQMQFDQRNAEVLAKEIGAEIVQINPLDPDWDGQMTYITNKLKSNLQ